jgi:hypothetical protein
VEERLRGLVAGRKPGEGGGGGAGAGAVTNGGGAAVVPAAAPQAAAAAAAQEPPPPPVLTAKCTLGTEARLVHFYAGATYAELADAVAVKFGLEWGAGEGAAGLVGEGGASAGEAAAAAAAAAPPAPTPPPPFALSFSDGAAGDGAPAITITERADLGRAVARYIEAAQAAALEEAGGAAGGAAAATAASRALAVALSSGTLPPLPLTVTLAAACSTPPPPPPQEEVAVLTIVKARTAARAADLRRYAAAASAEAAAVVADAAAAEAASAPQPPAADAWLLEFAALVRDRLGIDPDRHLDLAAAGWDRLTAAVEECRAAPEADAIFDAATAKFEEAAATAVVQAGNVDLARAHAALARAAVERAKEGGGKKGAPAPLPAPVVAAARKHLDAAASRYAAALASRPGYHDALAAQANLALERVKLAAGLAVPPAPAVPGESEGGPPDGTPAREAAITAAQNGALHGALALIDVAGLKKAAPLFEAAWAAFAEAEAAVPEADRGRKQVFPNADEDGGKGAAAAAAADGDGDAATPPPAAVGDANAWANVVVMWGNALFEASQLLAAAKEGEAAWKAPLDAAVAKFREAGCPEVDITAALRSHLRASELGLPAEGGEGVKEGGVKVNGGGGEQKEEKKGGLSALPNRKGKK